MKHIKKFNEKMGVPNGLINLAKIIYDSLLNNLKNGKYSYDSIEGDSNTYKYETIKHFYYMVFNINENINDFKINKINLEISIYEVKRQGESKAELTGAFYKPSISKLDRKNLKMYFDKNGEINLGISVEVPYGTNIEKTTAELFKNEQNEFISVIGHELMHSYDNYVKNHKPFKKNAKYNAFSNLRFGIPAVDEFFYYCYYISSTENIVRRAEIATKMEVQGITKEDFLFFLKNNKNYIHLKNVYNWTYEDFYKKLLEDVDYVKNVLEDNNFDLNGYSDEDVVNDLLSIILDNIINSKMNNLLNLLEDPVYNSIYSMIRGITDPDADEKNNYLDEFLKELKSEMSSPKKYFENKEKMFKFESGKLIKKIYKLYDMAKSEKTELHSKINSKKGVKKEVKNENSIINREKYLDSLGIKPTISPKKYL